MAQSPETSYRVLARKYRPGTFGTLLGQDTLVQVMQNSFAADRIAHAIILTGVRGVGKTTTARIIAKGLNCTGAGEEGGPTTEPCGSCDHCREIELGRHVDVLEMDAASRTGVADIRDIIDGVPFRPATARYKIYIIDEVHMLSTNAFNALLKTLEEPPDHVKFIFATTEIRMVPVTVLSRCQRFDLRRVEPGTLAGHLRKIAGLEGATIADDALALVIRASEGSVRDALSLLDQAIALTGGKIVVEDIRKMIGAADKGRILDLLELIMRGKAAAALAELSDQYRNGLEPELVLAELAEAVHWVSVLKISPEVASDPGVSPDERERGLALARSLTMPSLTRAWQIAIKAIDELAAAPNARIAAEMAVIRLCYVAELPSPEKLVRDLSGRQDAQQGEGMTPPPDEPAAASDEQAPAPMPSNEPAPLPPPATETPPAPVQEDFDRSAGFVEALPPDRVAEEPARRVTDASPEGQEAGSEADRVRAHELGQSVLDLYPDAQIRVRKAG